MNNFFDVVVFDNLEQNKEAQELSDKREIVEDYAEFSSHNLPRVLNYIGQSLLDGYCVELYKDGDFVGRFFGDKLSDQYEI